MARAKKKAAPAAYDPWEHWKSIQLTPEQKAEARAELEKLAAEAARKGVYEALRQLRGKVHLDLDMEELRRDRD